MLRLATSSCAATLVQCQSQRVSSTSLCVAFASSSSSSSSSSLFAAASCRRFFGGDWRDIVRARIEERRERAEIEKSIPKRVHKEDLLQHQQQSEDASANADEEGDGHNQDPSVLQSNYVVAHDISPTKIDEIVSRRMSPSSDAGNTTGSNEEDGDSVSEGNDAEHASGDTISSHDDAKAAFADRQARSNVIAEKRSKRREDNARWLMWQATQREKGFEQRVRRKIEKQRRARNVRFAQLEGRMLTVGTGSAADLVRRQTVELEKESEYCFPEEQGKKWQQDLDQSVAATAAAVATGDKKHPAVVAAVSDVLDDSELDDLLSVQDPVTWHRITTESMRRGALGGHRIQRTAAEMWGESKELRLRAK